MKPERPLFDAADGEAEARADARADANVAASRMISHAAVTRWLRSWGSDKLLPRPHIAD